MRVNAGTPTRVLVQCLARAGFGYLSGPESRALRVVLLTLSEIVGPQTATGVATANQIADRAGYTDRWTRHALHRLEEIGLITWTRGGISGGKPQPSRFTVARDVLVILIAEARESYDGILARRRERTETRIAALRRLTVRSKSHKRRSVHAEVTSTLLSTRSTLGPVRAPEELPPASPAARAAGLAACRAAMRG